jgi:hypothetical protein
MSCHSVRTELIETRRLHASKLKHRGRMHAQLIVGSESSNLRWPCTRSAEGGLDGHQVPVGRWHMAMIYVLTFLGLVASTTSCLDAGVSRFDPVDSSVAKILWLPAAAEIENGGFNPVMVKDGRSIYVDGTASVLFNIDSNQDELVGRIIEQFAGTEWVQRQTQYLNPQLQTSFTAGWQVHGGGIILGPVGRTIPYEPYRRWHGEWSNNRSDIVTYSIGGQGRRLRGVASYVPRSVVESSLRRLGQ